MCEVMDLFQILGNDNFAVDGFHIFDFRPPKSCLFQETNLPGKW